MADTRAQIVVSAVDNTKATFGAVKGRLGEIGGDASALAGKFAAVSGAIGGLLGAAGLGALVQQTVDGIDAFNDLADVTGSSVENLSRLEDTAVRTGASFDTVSAALLKFGQVLNAARPGSETEQIIKSIGLDVAELRRQDPVEAFESVARALSRYADDGNKARITQELFGRSVREVGPLLKDLAEQGLGVARVTTEQAQAAEQFNRQLAQLRKDATDAGRALVGELLPVISRLVREFTAGKEAFGGFFGALVNIGTSRTFSTATEGLQFYRSELERLRQAEAEILAGNDGQRFDIFGRDRIARTREAGVEIQKFITFYEKLLGLTNVQGGRGSIVPGGGRPSAPDLPTGGNARKPGKTPEDLLGDSSLTSPFRNRGRELTAEAEAEAARAREARAAATKALADQEERIAELTGLRAAKQQAEDLKLLDEAYFSGAITAEQYANGQQAIYKGLQLVGDETQKTTEKLSEFALQAQRNIQDALGDTLFQTLKGNFDNIGQAWTDLLLRLAAQAAAAKLGEALFGANGSGGVLSNVLASIFPRRAMGGPVTAGQPYIVGERQAELFVPNQSGTILPSAYGGLTFNQTFNVAAGASRADVLLAADQGRRAAVAEVRDLMQRGRWT